LVADTDVISAFWSGTMCHTLVHELSRDQPNTTKELLDIATRHAFGKEVVEAAFALGNGKTVPGGHQAMSSKATGKGAKKGIKAGKKGQKRHPRRVVVATSGNNDARKQMTSMRSMLQPLNTI
jgi:hypothetical protein